GSRDPAQDRLARALEREPEFKGRQRITIAASTEETDERREQSRARGRLIDDEDERRSSHAQLSDCSPRARSRSFASRPRTSTMNSPAASPTSWARSLAFSGAIFSAC